MTPHLDTVFLLQRKNCNIYTEHTTLVCCLKAERPTGQNNAMTKLLRILVTWQSHKLITKALGKIDLRQ